MDLVTYSYIN